MAHDATPPVRSATLEEAPWPVHLFDVPPDAITRVIIGCRASDETFDAIRQVVSEFDPVNRPELAEVRIHTKRFALELMPLDRHLSSNR